MDRWRKMHNLHSRTGFVLELGFSRVFFGSPRCLAGVK